jgi:hypothetical protein
MATNRAVAATSAAIVRVLTAASQRDPQLPQCTVRTVQAEQLRASPEDAVIGVFLYRVSLSEVQADDGLPAPGGPHAARPTVVDLHYLVTASAVEPLTSQHLLGWAMSVLHDNPVLSSSVLDDLPGMDEVFEDGETVSVGWEPLSLTDLHGVWEAAAQPAAPSATYVARAVRIDSTVSEGGLEPPRPIKGTSTSS